MAVPKENLQDIQSLQAKGFTQQEVNRLAKLRVTNQEGELQEQGIDPKRARFARWQAEHGLLSEDIPPGSERVIYQPEETVGSEDIERASRQKIRETQQNIRNIFQNMTIVLGKYNGDGKLLTPEDKKLYAHMKSLAESEGRKPIEVWHRMRLETTDGRFQEVSQVDGEDELFITTGTTDGREKARVKSLTREGSAYTLRNISEARRIQRSNPLYRTPLLLSTENALPDDKQSQVIEQVKGIIKTAGEFYIKDRRLEKVAAKYIGEKVNLRSKIA